MAKEKFRKDGKTYYRVPCSICDKNIVFAHGEAKTITTCPHCGGYSPWLLKPKTERLLFELQDKYFSTLDFSLWERYTEEIIKNEDDQNKEAINKYLQQRDETTLHKIYMLVFSYSEALVKKYLKENGFTISRDALNDYIQDVTFRWYENFTRKFGYKIEDSWAGFLKLKILEAMYNKSNRDFELMDSLDKVVQNKGESKETEMIDVASEFGITPLFGNKDYYDPYEEHQDIVGELKKVLKQIIATMDLEKNKDSRRRIILALTGFHLFLTKQEKKLAQFFELYGRDVKHDTELIKISMRKYLRNLLKQEVYTNQKEEPLKQAINEDKKPRVLLKY